MECFEFLKIEPTKDAKKIKIAYSNLLSTYSPETDPQGFQKLRHAYEEAVNYAKDNTEKENVKTPVDLFMDDFENVYNCYEKRLNKDSWTELLNRDICCNIDTSKEISEKILAFLMDDYNLPYDIWVLFDSYFSWTTKKDKLCTKFPKNFIDFVIYKISKKNSFRYEPLLSSQDGKQDEFINEYNNAASALDNFDIYTAKTSIDKIRKICPKHPDLLVLNGRYLIAIGNTNEAEAIFKDILNNHNDDLNGYFYLGDIYFKQCKMKESFENYKNALNEKPDSIGTLYNLGKCSLCLENYDDAIEYLEKFNDLAEYDNEVKNMLSSAYNFSIDSLREKLNENKDDHELKFKLAKALFKTEKSQECYDLLNELRQECELTPAMYLLLCQVLYILKNNDLAYTIACEAVEKYSDDFDLNFYKASALDDLKRYEEALAQYDKAISINDKNATAYNNKSFVLSKLKRYEEALSCANTAIELDPKMPYSYKNKAEALLNLNRYDECFDECEKSINLYQYMPEAYIVKMKALIKVRLYDEALLTYNKAFELNLKDKRLLLEKAHALELMRRYDEAIDFCDAVIKEDENYGEAYYYNGLCLYNKKIYEDALSLFDKAIELNCDSLPIAYYYKAQCLMRTKHDNEALLVIDTAIGNNFEGLDTYYSLKGTILSRQSKFEEAFNIYKKAIDYDSSFAGYYYSAGDALNDMKKFKEATEYMKKAIELDPSDSSTFVSLSYSYYNINEYENCIDCCNKAIQLNSDYGTAYQNKAWALYNLNRIKEAEDTLIQGLKIDGDNVQLLRLKLNILRDKGLNEEALVVTDRILEIKPDNKKTREIRNELLSKIRKKKGLLGSLFS